MDDISALMKAIDDGQITEVRRLLEAGVDANAMDEEKDESVSQLFSMTK